MTQEQIQEIKKRLNGTTPGPWGYGLDYPKHNTCWAEGAWEGDNEASANTDLMVHAKEDIANLLSHIEELEKERDAAIADARKHYTTCMRWNPPEGVLMSCIPCGYEECQSCESWVWRGVQD